MQICIKRICSVCLEIEKIRPGLNVLNNESFRKVILKPTTWLELFDVVLRPDGVIVTVLFSDSYC